MIVIEERSKFERVLAVDLPAERGATAAVMRNVRIFLARGEVVDITGIFAIKTADPKSKLIIQGDVCRRSRGIAQAAIVDGCTVDLQASSQFVVDGRECVIFNQSANATAAIERPLRTLQDFN